MLIQLQMYVISAYNIIMQTPRKSQKYVDPSSSLMSIHDDDLC